MEQEQLSDPLVDVVIAVPDVGLRVQRPGQHPEVGQTADERVCGGLEDADEEGTVRIGGHLDRDAALVRGNSRGLVGRRGQIANERIEEGPQADPDVGTAHQHRGEDRFLDALSKTGLEFGVGDLDALEVLGQDVVIGLGCSLEELVTTSSDLGLEFARDLDLGILGSVPSVGRDGGRGPRSP